MEIDSILKATDMDLLRYLFNVANLSIFCGREKETYTRLHFEEDKIPFCIRMRDVKLFQVIVFNHVKSTLKENNDFIMKNPDCIGEAISFTKERTLLHRDKTMVYEQVLLYGVLNFDWPENILSNKTLAWLYKNKYKEEIYTLNRTAIKINKNMVISLLHISYISRLRQFHHAGIHDPERLYIENENNLWKNFEKKKRKLQCKKKKKQKKDIIKE